MPIHALVMDGVFAADGAGGVRFCPAEGEDAHDVVPPLATIERRIETVKTSALLVRVGRRVDRPGSRSLAAGGDGG